MALMDRREAVRRISAVLGGAISAPTLAGLLAGCEAPEAEVGYTPRTLFPDELRRIEIIADLIIPETDTPGASAARVHEFIDTMLADFYPEARREQFAWELTRVDAVATSLFGERFDDLPVDRQRDVVAALDSEAYPDPSMEPERAREVEARIAEGEPPFMRTMKELTMAGYYTSEIGQTVELHLPPFGAYRGDVPLDEIGRSWA